MPLNLLTEKDRVTQDKVLKGMLGVTKFFKWFVLAFMMLYVIALFMQIYRGDEISLLDDIYDFAGIISWVVLYKITRKYAPSKYIAFDDTGIAFWDKSEKVFVPWDNIKEQPLDLSGASVFVPIAFKKKVAGVKAIRALIYDADPPNITMDQSRELIRFIRGEKKNSDNNIAELKAV
jgi:DUF2075 family protein